MTISLKNLKKVISKKADKYFTKEYNQWTTANLDKELLIKFITKKTNSNTLFQLFEIFTSISIALLFRYMYCWKCLWYNYKA